MHSYVAATDGTFTVLFYPPSGSVVVIATSVADEPSAQALVSFLNGGVAP